MFGTTRESFCSIATRTFTVALPLSALGTIAITWDAIFQSGYASSTDCAGMPGST